MSLSTPALLVMAITSCAAVVNAYFFHTGVRDGNRALALCAAGASLVFVLVAAATSRIRSSRSYARRTRRKSRTTNNDY
jgi:hypothetical protein